MNFIKNMTGFIVKKKKKNQLADFFLYASTSKQRKILNKVAESVNRDQREVVEKYKTAQRSR